MLISNKSFDTSTSQTYVKLHGVHEFYIKGFVEVEKKELFKRKHGIYSYLPANKNKQELFYTKVF